MKKGLATIAAGSLALVLSSAAGNATERRECDHLTPCDNGGNNTTVTNTNGNWNSNSNTNGNWNSNSNTNNNSNNNSNTNTNTNNNNSNSNSNAMTSTQVRNTIKSTTINPATPGTIYGQVNGQCMATRGVSIGAYLGSIALQNSEFNMNCMAWNSAMILLDRGIDLHDPAMQAVGINTLRQMDRRIDNSVIDVLLIQQDRIKRGLGMAMSAWELTPLDGYHGQEQRQTPRYLTLD